MAQDIERSPVGAGYRPQRVHGSLQQSSTDASALGASVEAIEDAEVFQPRSVQVSWIELQIPDTAFVSATQQVGSFTQSATGDVSGGGTSDASASQQVGAFTQNATAQAWAGLQAAQTVGAFSQSASAAAWASAAATQVVGAFPQSASAEAPQGAVEVSWAYLAVPETTLIAEQPEPGATPGYDDARSRTYRVRVGKRWMRVDPLDAATLRAVYAAAEEEAQRIAAVRVVEPAKSAARAVVVTPDGPAVDYAGLAADAKRISEQVREVYAAALQRELIARLMREQMDREDDDAVLMLLLG